MGTFQALPAVPLQTRVLFKLFKWLFVTIFTYNCRMGLESNNQKSTQTSYLPKNMVKFILEIVKHYSY